MVDIDSRVKIYEILECYSRDYYTSHMVSIAALLPIVIGLFGAAIVFPWDKTIITEPLSRNTTATENCGPINGPEYSRRTVFFPSKGLQLEGWLYIPKVSEVLILTIVAWAQ